ncbi:MAG: hypothetical protein LVR00_07380 [Rhabdochlamydiaceae bacterium]|jgi:uncharacterized coiled-coil protein SlyX
MDTLIADFQDGIKGLPHQVSLSENPDASTQLVSREKVNELVGAFIAQISDLWRQLTGRVDELTTALAGKTAECDEMRRNIHTVLNEITTKAQDLYDSVKEDVEKRTGDKITKLQEQLTASNAQVDSLQNQLNSLPAKALAFSTQYSLPVGVAGIAALGLGLLGKAYWSNKDTKKQYACTALVCAGFAAVCFALFSTPAAAKALAHWTITK